MPDGRRFRDVYVADFSSREPATCRPADVPLDHAGARAYFQRARVVDYKTIHDHYDVAPCRVEGTLSSGGRICTWTIDAGAVGEVRCGDTTIHFVCDDCDDLFEGKAAK